MLMLFILTLIVVLIFSFIFSGAETGFISWNRLKVSHAAAQGDFNARLAVRLMNRRGQFISAILIGNNICNISATLLFVSFWEQFGKMIAVDLSKVPSPESWVLTPVMLLFSEILPKSLFRTYPFKLTLKSVPVIAALFYAASPVFWVFNTVPKILGRKDDGGSAGADVREEIILVAVEGAKRGNIFESADRIMKNTLEMKGRRIGEITVSLEDWKKIHTVYKSSQMIYEFTGNDSGAALSDEVIVFDDDLAVPTGSVSLLDVAAHRSKEPSGMKLFSSLSKPLPKLRNSMGILSCLRRMAPDAPRYHLVLDGDNIIGILDKMTLFETAFLKE